MISDLPEIRSLCADIPEVFVNEHVKRLPGRYFECFKAGEIAGHIYALYELSPEKPVTVYCDIREDMTFECTFLAFDYKALFSILTGILTSTQCNIKTGNVFSYSPLPEYTPDNSNSRRFKKYRLLKGRKQKAGAGKRRIIDRFFGKINTDKDITLWQEELKRITLEAVYLLEKGKIDKARNSINKKVIQRISQENFRSAPVLFPVQLEENNDDPTVTKLKIISEDTPAFLYSLSNALSLQGVSIERVDIRTINNRIEDVIGFVDRHGNKITEPELLDKIKLSALFTKQFTYFLFKAPDTYTALRRFEHLMRDILKKPERGHWFELLSNPHSLGDLARLLGTSDLLWEDFLRLQHEALLPILKSHLKEHRFFQRNSLAVRLEKKLASAKTSEEQIRKLNEFKDQEIFLIDLDHILGVPNPAQYLGDNLTYLAELVLRKALEFIYKDLVAKYGVPRTVGGMEARFALLGLGKFGGNALGYASDIELLFVYSDNGQTDGENNTDNTEFFNIFVMNLLKFIKAKREGIFNIDLQLRPYGKDSPLACSLETFCRYYGAGGSAHSYERLSLVRLRGVAGDRELCERIERLRDEYIYSSLGAAPNINIKELQEIRKKQYEEKTRGKTANAKFSPGALVDLEYDVQMLQILYGRDRSELRTPEISKALDALAEAGILNEEERENLIGAYYFLRRVINGLRMLRGNAQDLFLPNADSEEFVHLARRIGYQKKDDLEPEKQLHMEFAARTAAIRAFAEKHFGRKSLPKSETGNVADLILSENPSFTLKGKILSGFGIKQIERAYVNLLKLAENAESHQSFAMLAVLAFDFLRNNPDPDMALNNWERFMSLQPNPEQIYTKLLSQPKRLEILFQILGGSQFLAETLIINPDFFDWVTTPGILNRKFSREDFERELKQISDKNGQYGDWLDAIRKYRRKQVLRIGTRDICLGVPVKDITEDLSILAESFICASLDRIWKNFSKTGIKTFSEDIRKRFCVIALGKLGGSELNYSSDIDLIGLYTGDSGELFQETMEKLRASLSSSTKEGYVYRVDFRLRPYGTSGQLACPLAELIRYYKSKASLWEIQALIKARPVAGNKYFGSQFLKTIQPVIIQERSRQEIVKSIDKTRTGMRHIRHSSSAFSINVKVGKGGIRDIEFLIQGLQLIHAHENPNLLNGNTLVAMKLLEKHNYLPSNIAKQLQKDYIFLRKIEHYLQIMEDRQTHSLPVDPDELEALARRVLGKGEGISFEKEFSQCVQRVHNSYKEYLING